MKRVVWLRGRSSARLAGAVAVAIAAALAVGCEESGPMEPAALASITVTPNPATLPISSTQQYAAVGRDAGGNVVAISPTWSVVSGGGVITSGALFTAGTVPGSFGNTIQATSGSISGTAMVMVTAGPLATITISPSPVTLPTNGTQQYTAVGRDAGGNVVAIAPTWSVVAGGGVITGGALFTAGTLPGSYTNTIQATSGGISGNATVTVIVGSLATITVTPNPDTLAINGTQQYSAVGRDAGGNVVAIAPTWSVVAGGGSISSGGLFTAGTVPGAYPSTVQAANGSCPGPCLPPGLISGTATVVVTAGALASITVTPNPDTLPINGTQQYTAVGKDAGGNVVAISPVWSIVAGGGAINAAGLFTAGVVPGSFANTVAATSGSVSGTATLVVTTGVLTSITVSPNPVTLSINGTQQYSAVGRDAGGNVVAITPTWSVVAGGGAITSGALFTAGTVPGTYTNTIKATSGSASGTATVTVTSGALASITVSPNSVTLPISGTQPYSAVGRDASGNIVAITPTWSVVASMSAAGTITSGAGLFTAGTIPGTYADAIVATSGSISGTATVTVTTGVLASITVSPNPVTLPTNGTQQFTAAGKDAGGNVVAITPTWSVVAGGGVITSGALFTAGTVPGAYTNTIQATSGSISGNATVTVIVGSLATITVTPNPVTLGIGGMQQYSAVGKDAGGNVVAITPTWSVVAGGGSVGSSSGLFTAGTVPGTYTNTVQAMSGTISGTATVSVIAGSLATITVSPNPVTLSISGTQQYTAEGRDAGGNIVAIVPVWSIVAGGGAITGAGMFTAGTVPGTYTNTIQATSGSVSGTATVNVIAGSLATIAVSPNPVTLSISGTQQYTAVGRDAGGNVVAITPTWSVVAGGGAITSGAMFTAGTAPGTYTNTIQATSGSISGNATLTVVVGSLASITVSPNPVTLPINGAQQYTAVGKDAGGNPVAITPTWSVVAGGGAISSGALFTAGTTPGTFTNTIQATSGVISGNATVTVTTGALASITVSPIAVTLPTIGTQQYTAVGKDAGGNVVAITPTWSVVAGGGVITSGALFTAGPVPGTYTNTIQAASGSVSGNASVTVIVGSLATITITPNPDTLAIGGMQQYSAVGKDAGGNVVVIAPVWSIVASGGAISGTGLFTAGASSGTFTNTVQATSGSVSGFATVTILPTAQSITFAQPATPAVYGSSFPIAPTASSGLTVIVTPSGGCTISAGTVTMTSGTTACVLTASQPGNVSYSAAADVVRTVAASLLAASVTPNAASKVFGAVDPTLSGTLTGFLAGDNVTASYNRAVGEAVGTYPINATLSATGGAGVLANYAITHNTAVFTITQAAQATVTVSVPASGTVGEAGLLAIASGGSGTGAYSYASSTAAVCTVDAGTGAITALTVGTCSVTASRAADANYLASATSAAASFTIGLGAAASFAVLGGSGASSCTGVSMINGNVGVDPLGTISGFPLPCVIGSPGDAVPHVNDATAAAAQANVTTVNTSLTGMACTTDLTGQDLGGKTLTPGVYCFTSTAQLTGNLVLSGSATDVWVFKIGTTLTTAASDTVALSGSAQARNVYWQVGSAATLCATNTFQGNIIATTSITVGASTSLIGRALAKVAVILDTDMITLP